MSARMRLNAGQLRALAVFLDEASTITQTTGISLCAYGDRARVVVPALGAADEIVLSVSWDAETERYIVDDMVGG